MIDSPTSQPSDQPWSSGDSELARHQRLWTPWRMRYVGGGASESGCIFCNRLAAEDDVLSLILHRGTDAFVIMNLFPYNTGHTMIVPNEHMPSPEVASPAAVAEMSGLRGPVLRALRRSLSCHGFNLGLNIGAEAGAGIAEHLHEHVVPRWIGDANFMPVLANTTVMPELIPITYAKLRAELVRELIGSTTVHCVIVTADDALVLVDATGSVPSVPVVADEPVWKCAIAALRPLVGTDLHVTGWAAPVGAGDGTIGLSFRATPSAPEPTIASGWRWRSIDDAARGPTGALVRNALTYRSP